MEPCIRKNNSKKAYQLVKDLATEKQGKSTTIQGKFGECLTVENEILNRWAENCSDFYIYETDRDTIVLDCPQIPDGSIALFYDKRWKQQVSEPEGAPQNKYSISRPSARNTCSISRISTMSSRLQEGL